MGILAQSPVCKTRQSIKNKLCRWMNRQAERQLAGHQPIVNEIKMGASSKIMRKLKSYFVASKNRMQYKNNQDMKAPMGSGVIESAIRRVVNLRLKSPGSFWKLDFAETMIYLRTQLLYDRSLTKAATTPAWTTSIPATHLIISAFALDISAWRSDFVARSDTNRSFMASA